MSQPVDPYPCLHLHPNGATLALLTQSSAPHHLGSALSSPFLPQAHGSHRPPTHEAHALPACTARPHPSTAPPRNSHNTAAVACRAQTQITQGIFRRIHDNGHLVERTNKQLYSLALDKFLADRYVVGTCPKCGYEDARGDQCDNCGSLLNPTELRNPRCKFSGTQPVLRETSHLHINLPQLEEKLREYIDGASKQARHPPPPPPSPPCRKRMQSSGSPGMCLAFVGCHLAQQLCCDRCTWPCRRQALPLALPARKRASASGVSDRSGGRCCQCAHWCCHDSDLTSASRQASRARCRSHSMRPLTFSARLP